ncbi:hypothetical protein [Streptomyces noursei]|uniref:hypothetical protein n=1 Tax=Streptomyces noursei TaxID=1971 RepID=UPI00382F9C10
MLCGFGAGPVIGPAWEQAAFTITFVLIFTQLSVPDWHLSEQRLVDVLLGGAIGAVARSRRTRAVRRRRPEKRGRSPVGSRSAGSVHTPGSTAPPHGTHGGSGTGRRGMAGRGAAGPGPDPRRHRTRTAPQEDVLLTETDRKGMDFPPPPCVSLMKSSQLLSGFLP